MLSLSRETARTRVREAAARIGPAQGLHLVVLFGSTTDPGRSAPRDLDLALQGRGGALLDLVDLTNRFARETGIQEVDLVDLTRADPVLLGLVARDGVPLYESEPGAFARFASLAARRFADTRKFRDAEAEEVREFLARRPVE